MTNGTWTAEQYMALGIQVCAWASGHSNRVHFSVTPELGNGKTMMVRITDNSGDEPHAIVIGIEPDGHAHS